MGAIPQKLFDPFFSRSATAWNSSLGERRWGETPAGALRPEEQERTSPSRTNAQQRGPGAERGLRTRLNLPAHPTPVKEIGACRACRRKRRRTSGDYRNLSPLEEDRRWTSPSSRFTTRQRLALPPTSTASRRIPFRPRQSSAAATFLAPSGAPRPPSFPAHADADAPSPLARSPREWSR